MTRPPSHGNVGDVAGRSWRQSLAYLALVAAAVIDVVTFQQILAGAVNVDDTATWGVAVGFTAVAVYLSHTVGKAAHREFKPPAETGMRTIAVLALAGWTVLGVVAFVFRLVHTDPATALTSETVIDGQVIADPAAAAQASDKTLSAVLFLSFFIATGLVSGIAGFFQHAPPTAMQQYRWAIRQRRRTTLETARLTYALATTDKSAVEVAEAYAAAQSPADARHGARLIADDFKRRARWELFKRRTGGNPPPHIGPTPSTRR